MTDKEREAKAGLENSIGIAEFARNEMIRADHTISWAGEIFCDTDGVGFLVKSMGDKYVVTVTKVRD